jgi:hypothetical protein
LSIIALLIMSVLRHVRLRHGLGFRLAHCWNTSSVLQIRRLIMVECILMTPVIGLLLVLLGLMGVDWILLQILNNIA